MTYKMSNGNQAVTKVLSDICGAAIEYDLHKEPNEFINFIDLYCTYLQNRQSDGDEPDNKTATFLQFICDQTMLDIAASSTAFVTGERLVAPQAIKSLGCPEVEIRGQTRIKAHT